MTRTIALLALPLLTTLAGCGKDKTDDSTPPTTTVPSACGNLTAVAAEKVSTAVTFSWTLDETGPATVSLDLDGELTTLTATGGPNYTATGVGLVTGGDYTWEAVVDGADGPVSCGVQTLKVAPAPTVILKFDLNVSEPGSAMAAGGNLVISTLQSDSAWNAIIDGQGRYRFVYGTDDPSYTVAHTRWSRDGQSLLWNQFDRERILDVGSIARVSLDGSVDTRTRTYLAHHDFVELPDGTFGWLGYDRRDFAMDAGSAPVGAQFGLHCPNGLCPVAGEILLEGAEGITGDNDAVEIMNWWENWDTDPWWVCNHMWDYSSFVPDYYEWFHANSLAYVDSEDAYYVMSRFQDAVFKVDRATGAIVWQMGGIDSDFTLTSGEWFDHGHMSEVFEGGFRVFDNGDHRGYSRVTEYSFDETTMEVQQVWSYDEPGGGLLVILGDLKMLPNGNYLVVWSADAKIQEITPAGVVVWELQSASGGFGVVARADFVENLPTQMP